jgi:hypothetical protein
MVKHFLKNGKQVDSIEGIVIKKEDFPGIYDLMDRMNERLAKEKAQGGDN